MSELEPVIGLEIHVQLATRTKLFCGDLAEFGGEPNTHVCPVCLGLPGALPVTNGAAVQLAVRAALGFGCTVHERSRFARKNYFYPDLPKGYQITQFDRPFATAGAVRIATDAGERTIRIRRIHLEEDAGKSLHDRIPESTAIDLNRAGTPLVEIVTEPDLHTPAECRAFLLQLKRTLEYLEVSDCDMEKGSLRVDANVSVRRQGDPLGTKTELKNMNSFSNVERAVTYEIERQREIVTKGGRVVQETLLWDAARATARSMRSKEDSHDYRYFDEPDLPTLVIERAAIEAQLGGLPELPQARATRLEAEYTLPAYDADVLTATRAIADYFEAVAHAAGDGKLASNWVMTDVLAWTNEHSARFEEFPVPPGELGALIRLVAEGVISTTTARQKVLPQLLAGATDARAIVEQQGLAQVSDDAQLAAWVEAVVQAHPNEIERVRAGDPKLMGFLMGQVMKQSQGRADPKKASTMLRTMLAS